MERANDPPPSRRSSGKPPHEHTWRDYPADRRYQYCERKGCEAARRATASPEGDAQ